MTSLTKAQVVVVEDILTEWCEVKSEAICDAYNYGMDRDQVKELGKQLNDAASILGKLGDKHAVENYSFSAEHIEELMDSARND